VNVNPLGPAPTIDQIALAGDRVLIDGVEVLCPGEYDPQRVYRAMRLAFKLGELAEKRADLARSVARLDCLTNQRTDAPGSQPRTEAQHPTRRADGRRPNPEAADEALARDLGVTLAPDYSNRSHGGMEMEE